MKQQCFQLELNQTTSQITIHSDRTQPIHQPNNNPFRQNSTKTPAKQTIHLDRTQPVHQQNNNPFRQNSTKPPAKQLSVNNCSFRRTSAKTLAEQPTGPGYPPLIRLIKQPDHQPNAQLNLSSFCMHADISVECIRVLTRSQR